MAVLADQLFAPHGARAYLRWLTPGAHTAALRSTTADSRPVVKQPEEIGDGIALARSGVSAAVGGSLLESVESAGLTPPNRCRRGVCATCTTNLVSGTVRDTRTGDLIEGPAPVRLCVTEPCGPVVVDL